jgi:hypothetical protein
MTRDDKLWIFWIIAFGVITYAMLLVLVVLIHTTKG